VNSLIRVCQKCGTEIPIDAPEGGCPGCLLETALDAAGGQMVFGRYTLVKVLGRGGMGIVWLAHDEELERDVALKFLPDLMIQDRALLDQLKRETKRSLELTHPHIVRIHDFVHDERSGCISMEYVDGETLSNLRAEKEQKVFEPSEIAEWIGQLCDALDYAHNRAKIIHRDLKPTNLMVNQRGDLKITDFGIARSLADSATRLTSEQGRSGTLVYMSPQQLNGERGTHLDDIYSLGATVYELLTSKPPFYSGNIDRQICERVAPSLTERRKELDVEPASVSKLWEDAVAACLVKDPSQRPQSAAEVAQRLQLASSQARTRRAPGKSSNRKALLIGGVAALAVLALGGVYFGALKRHAKPVLPAAAIPEKSIAVLPFENLSADQENAFFTDGVQDEILTDLAKVADLKVISRTSVMQYKSGVKRNLREIANALGVAHVVEGSVQRAANRVRVSAQLIDARTDTHVWAEHFDRPLDDVFAIQSEIAKTVADQLQAKLSPREKAVIEQQPTADIAAYDDYVRAKTLLAVTTGARQGGNLYQAQRLLEQAIARDPAFFLAHCKLAWVHKELYYTGFDHSARRLAQANEAVRKALELGPDRGEAHLAAGWVYYHCYFDYHRARSELAIARSALPNEPEVFELAGYMDRRQGHWREHIQNLERAAQLDPRNVQVLHGLAQGYKLLRQFPDMAAVLDRILAITPAEPQMRVMRASVDLEWHADTSRLRAVIHDIISEDPSAGVAFTQDWLLYALCERNPAEIQSALALIPREGITSETARMCRPFYQGLAARALKDTTTATNAFVTARGEMEKIVQEEPDYPQALSVLGMIDAALDRKEDAVREAQRAVELLGREKDPLTYAELVKNLAVVYAWTGEKEAALSQLNILLQIPSPISYGQLRLHPYWDPLRSDPRFEKLVAESTKPVAIK
jgi:serine/threonine protein kinase/Tfp pilus assembly protein PilF